MGKPRIFVFGSLNVDFVQRVTRLPSIGETVQGSNLEILAGGKGANQACAASRLGGSVTMLGKVGGDAFGQQLKAELFQAGVDVQKVEISEASTGAATILVLPDGSNLIVISPGANGDFNAETAAQTVLEGAPGDLLLCQLETPMAANLAVLRAARERKMITILDPAPAQNFSAELLTEVSILTPNQPEAFTILNEPARPIDSLADGRQLATALLQRGPATVIVKLGGLGSVVADHDGTLEIPGLPVPVVDTTGAGDVYNGGLAVALAHGKPMAVAACFANAAAALSVTKFGAMNSAPTLADLQTFLHQQEGATARSAEEACLL